MLTGVTTCSGIYCCLLVSVVEQQNNKGQLNAVYLNFDYFGFLQFSFSQISMYILTCVDNKKLVIMFSHGDMHGSRSL